MELIYLAFILFIAGVAGTILYDKMKAEKQARSERLASAPPKPVRKPRSTKSIYEEEAEAFEAHIAKKRKAATSSPAAKQLDQLIAQVKFRQAAGEKQLTVTEGVKTQTYTITQLLKKLEEAKKKL